MGILKKPTTFFVIDDDPDDREIFTAAVSEVDGNINCVTVDNCEEALSILKNNQEDLPDYIFLDLNMPRINGRQCLVELKKLAHLKHIPVIIYSTSSLVKDIEETQQLGASMFITKPSKFEELCSALHKVIALELPRKSA